MPDKITLNFENKIIDLPLLNSTMGLPVDVTSWASTDFTL